MWDYITLGSEKDETIAFGCTGIPDGLQTFQTQTLATISASSQATHKPTVVCVSSPSYFVAAVNTELIILGESCSDIVGSVKLDSCVDCLALCDVSPSLLLICQNNGYAHLFHISAQTRLLSWKLLDKEKSDTRAFMQAFFCSSVGDFVKIYVFAATNELITISNLNLLLLNDAVEDGNINKISNDIEIKYVDISVQYPRLSPSCAFPIQAEDGSFCTGLAGGELYSVLVKLSEFGSEMSMLCGKNPEVLITKIAETRDGKYLVAIDSEHTIRIFCSSVLIPIMTVEVRNVCDFILMETDSTSCIVPDHKIGLLTCPSPDMIYKENCSFCIYKFPSLEPLYKVNLTSYAWLVHCSPNQDYIYVIEGESSGLPGSDFVSALRIKAVSEFLPEARLAHLLNKRKFCEAEEFADLHQLDKQVIYKAKARHILENLSRAESMLEKDVDKAISDLEAILCKIQDVAFLKSCLAIKLPTVSHAKHFFGLFNGLLENLNCDHDITKELMSQINKLLNRICTYEIISASNSRNFEWHEFLTLNLLDFLFQELRSGSMKAIFVLWQRHQRELVNSLTDGNVEQILQTIPESVRSNVLIPFLRDSFLPSVFFKIPSAINITALWLVQKTFMLEITEKDCWPENGKELLELLPNVCDRLNKRYKSGATSFSCYLDIHNFDRESLNYLSPIGQLINLNEKLKTLIFLQKECGCHLSLADFSQVDKMSTVFIVLNRIDISMIGKVLHQFLRKFAAGHNLVVDLCLLQYIKEVLHTSPYTWWHWEEAPWEEKLVALTECIRETTVWMEAAMAIIFQAPIPWSPRVQKLVDIGLSFDHVQSEELKIQSQFVGLKKVLMKYDLRTFQINHDAKLAYWLAKYILKQGKDTAVEDVLEVFRAYESVSTSDAYFLCLQFFLKNNMIGKFSALLSSLPTSVPISCCVSLVRYVNKFLCANYFSESQKSYLQILAKGGILASQHLKKCQKPFDASLLALLSTLSKLQEEFGIYASPDQLASSAFCWEILSSTIDKLLDGKFCKGKEHADQKQTKYQPSFSVIYRLGDILSLNKEEVMAVLMFKLMERNKSSLVIKLCGEVLEYCNISRSPETLMAVVKRVSTGLAYTKEDFDTLTLIVLQLANLAIAYSTEESLGHCLNARQIIRTVSSISHLSRPQDQWDLLSTYDNSNDSYHNWKFSEIYKDEGLWIDVENVIEFVKNTVPILCIGGLHAEEFIPLGERIKQLIDYLQDKGQRVAAFQVLMCSVHLLPQYVQDITAAAESLNFEPDLGDTVFSILQKILFQRKMDYTLFLGFLNILSDKKAIITLVKLAKKCGTDAQRLLRVITVGIEYAYSHQLEKMHMEFLCARMTAFWMSKLPDVSVNAEEVLKPMVYTDKWNIVKKIVISKKLDLDTLDHCCTELDVDYDDALIVSLSSVLEFAMKDLFNSDSIPLDEVALVLKEAEKIISRIVNAALVINALEVALQAANPYCYEILLFIYEQLLKVAEETEQSFSQNFAEAILLLKFLQTYKRVSLPSEIERENWFARNPLDKKLPVLASSRLPFNLLYQESRAYKIINPELTSRTVDVWLSVSALLKLTPDHLIMIAARNTVTNYVEKQKPVTTSGMDFTPDHSFLRSLRELLLKINDPDTCVACARWITGKMPPGANKTLMAKGAFTLAKEWNSNSPNDEKAHDTLKIVTKVHQQLGIEQTLHDHDLNDDVSLSLMNRPRQMMEYLIENCCTCINDCIKVWYATQEICEIAQCDVNEIHYSYLYKWLSPSKAMDSHDESFSILGSPQLSAFDGDADEKNMKRAIFFLLAAPAENFQSLVKLLNKKMLNLSTAHRTRFLCCLLSVADSQTISSVCGPESLKLKEHLRIMEYVAALESLHLPFTVSIFAKSSKLELIKKILSDHGRNSKVLVVCVKMCMEYEVWHPQVWEVILQRMTTLSMTEELEAVLEAPLGDIAHIWHSQAFVNAWSYLIQSLLKRKGSLKELDESDLSVIFHALLRCPCLVKLNLRNVLENLEYSGLLAPHIIQKLKSAMDSSSFLLTLQKQIYSRKLKSKESVSQAGFR